MQRRQRRWGLLIGVFALAVTVVGGISAASSMDFEHGWFTIDSGGGSASGSGYTIDGTIGQPDAASTSGGGYVLNGGFWTPHDTTKKQLFLPFIAR
ncbi:hypothetical protein [Herpetosiphon geysericola]|uniref:Uncharacterized protein n=1 Tax=Herpetosiphon geysericola TaxID=70996 RepID=A0A0P6Y5C6_9CHLR|nr:hypothetical protein [Herpetosiphon geysericola]KPL80486.1 hypothetical protein SE18_23775 [Herpetosiphon geysericola]